MTKTVRALETARQAGEDVLLQLAQLSVADAAVPEIQAAAQRQARQQVLDLGTLVLQLRMAATEGRDMVEHIFSPVAGFDELPEEQGKAFRERKKEKEKEETARATAAQAAAQSAAQSANRGGGYYRGAYRGRGGYGYQPYQVPQQYAPQGPCLMVPPPQPGVFQSAPTPQQQGWGQPPPPGQQYGYQTTQQRFWHPDGYNSRGRGFQGLGHNPRAAAKCYGCGVNGHFNKDNACLPGAREAYQALQAAMQAGQQVQQLSLTNTGGN